MREAGYVEGSDLLVEVHSAEGNYDAITALISRALARKPDILVVENTLAVRAAKSATTSVPIVIAVAADPLGSGLVASMARPGGNITGLSMMITDLAAKRFQLLREAMPHLKRLGILRDASVPWHPATSAQLEGLARANGIEPFVAEAHTPAQVRTAILGLARRKVQALYVLDNAFFSLQQSGILQLCAELRIAAVYGSREWAADGALLSYSADFGEMFHRAAFYADKILRGAKPGDLPLEQPTKFDLVFNLRTAKALGLPVPQSLLVQATEVIR